MPTMKLAVMRQLMIAEIGISQESFLGPGFWVHINISA